MTSANLVLQTILGAPFAWRWNRKVTGFITTQGQQDYTIFNWTATFAVSTGWVLVDSNGNCQSVTTAGTTGSTIPTFNATKGSTTTDGSAVWTNLGSINTPVSTTYNFDWIETTSIQLLNPNTQSPYWKEIPSKLCLSLDSAQSPPNYISAQSDDGNGNVTFRLMPVPDMSYPVAITIQQKPPILDSVNATWTPIPDEYSRLYTWGFVALMLFFGDDVSRFQLANQKFIASLLGASQGLSQTQINIFLQGWSAITGQPIVNEDRVQQGTQARGV
jgi:hypothetical protein